MEMMTSFFAIGEDVWLTLLKAKEETLDLDSTNGVEELLALYKHAEEDFLLITILKRHAEFILARCEGYAETEKPQELGELFLDNWTRNALGEVVNKGISHLTQSHLLWDQLGEWEIQTLQNLAPVPEEGVPSEEAARALANVAEFILARLGRPRATFYGLRVPARQRIQNPGQAVKAFQRRETWETSLESRIPEAYALHIASKRRAKYPSYTYFVHYASNSATQERAEDQDEASVQSISEIYEKALSLNLLQSNVEQLIPCAEYDKQRYDSTDRDEDHLITMVAALETSIELAASPTGDLRLRLKKYLTSIKVAATHYKTSYNAWISHTDALIKNRQHDMACKTFVDLHLKKNLDWLEAIWEAWLAFEHLHGSVQRIDLCDDKVEKAQYVINTRRVKVGEPRYSKPTPLKRANSTVFVPDLPAGVTEEELTALFKDDLHHCSPSPAN
ncbi:hypothetical protein K438DRAFT_1977016 [Mycena galopus ATCC 62051]|nr:hypothetical protein K438DRAFT_1977016 [Mycena galopus ATCC 62051]